MRVVKSEAEIAYVREAARLGDEALEAMWPLVREGADEGVLLPCVQGDILLKGGDYPANPFILGSGEDASSAATKSGRRRLWAHRIS